MSDYQRIARAIDYIVAHSTDQPSLAEIAAHINLSPSHFQRLFCRWAGITPKRFQQALVVAQGKTLFDRGKPLLEVADEVGLSSGSRLYDHFVQLEAVTPGEYKKRAEGVKIEYGVHDSPFGALFLASTPRGICRAAFVDFACQDELLRELKTLWPSACLTENQAVTAAKVTEMFAQSGSAKQPLSLHVTGTNFQISVWKALLQIPYGRVVSYSQIAALLGRPQSARAVGNAVGANPVAFIVPCHRVIQQSGALGGYRWGPSRKQTMHLWEALSKDEG